MAASVADNPSSRPTSRDAPWTSVRSSGSQTGRFPDCSPEISPLHTPYKEQLL